MNFKHGIIIGISAIILAMPSCKKDSTTTTSNYLGGAMSFYVPAYVVKDQQITATPSGVTHPEDLSLGYYWKASWATSSDTTKLENGSGDGKYSFTIPDTLGVFTITCSAYATDYYPTSGTDTLYIVDPEINTTITNADLSYSHPYFKDSRDSKPYFTTTIGSQTWTKNNLGYEGAGVAYKNSPAMDRIAGRFYSWNEAQTACPDGWHLPSDAEFVELAKAVASDSKATFSEGETLPGVAGAFMVDAKFLDEKMWTFWPEVKITNKSGLSVIPVGYGVEQGTYTRFKGFNYYAAFWTSNENGENGGYRYIFVDKTDIFFGLGNKDAFKASVRCLKD